MEAPTEMPNYKRRGLPGYCILCGKENTTEFKTCLHCRLLARVRDVKKRKFPKEPEPHEKRCTKCRQVKQIDAFSRNNATRAAYCKLCLAKRHGRVQMEVIRLKMASSGCVVCGERRPLLLEADHVLGNKRACVSSLGSFKAVHAELAKTQWLCSFHHYMKSAREKRGESDLTWFYATNIDEIKHRVPRTKRYICDRKREIGCCEDCGRWLNPQDPDECSAFHWDHRDRETKFFDISDSNAMSGITVRGIDAEIAKCRLICANCHRMRTWDQMDYGKYLPIVLPCAETMDDTW